VLPTLPSPAQRMLFSGFVFSLSSLAQPGGRWAREGARGCLQCVPTFPAAAAGCDLRLSTVPAAGPSCFVAQVRSFPIGLSDRGPQGCSRQHPPHPAPFPAPPSPLETK
uniref:Uncharacterized protein n=1 Tax=Zosterops lateralis melanops TaxID=1220523 RepID=A0A8D2QQV9_ZOSLA